MKNQLSKVKERLLSKASYWDDKLYHASILSNDYCYCLGKKEAYLDAVKMLEKLIV